MYCKNIYLIALLLAPLVSSYAELYQPKASDASANNVNLAYLNQGRSLYIKNCTACHAPHQPSEYTRMQWAVSINKMQKRSRITDIQKEMIFRYLSLKAK